MLNRMQGIIFLVIAVIQSVFLYKFLVTESSSILIGGIIFIAILLILIPNVENLKLLQFNAEGLRVELEDIKKDTLKNREETLKNTEEISNLILMSMGENTYKNLVKINRGDFGKYKMPEHEGLETELYFLRNMGFIERIEGSCPSIHKIPPEGDQLSLYVAITEKGRKYIELREKLAK